MIFVSWFDGREAEAFGRQLAKFIVDELKGEMNAKDQRYKNQAEKVLAKAARQLKDFRTGHSLNFYKKSRLANAFLWTLKDEKFPSEYADQMTEWLTVRL